MEDIVVPTTTEIFNMSSMRCQQERIRLKNEISFARGDETTGAHPTRTESPQSRPHSNKSKIACRTSPIVRPPRVRALFLPREETE